MGCEYIDRTAAGKDWPKPDPAYKDLNTSYKDSYAVRAWPVACDLTGDVKYLHPPMVGPGATAVADDARGRLLMNPGRNPGETKGDWFVADGSSTALGVLATAVRVPELAENQHYLDSVRSSPGWSSTTTSVPTAASATGSVPVRRRVVVLHRNLRVGGALPVQRDGARVLSRRRSAGGRLAEPAGFAQGAAGDLQVRCAGRDPVLFRGVFDGPALPGGGQARPLYGGNAEIPRGPGWMARNQEGRGGKPAWGYESWRGAKFGGLPFHMYVYARNVPGNDEVADAADQELRYITQLLARQNPPVLSALRSVRHALLR